MEWIEPCPLKVNLCLGVGHLQADGYHEVETLFWRLPSPEILTIREINVNNVRDRIFRSGDPFAGEHLVRRALDLLRRHGAVLPPLEIGCSKVVPAGGGVGGGSGNAAALIRWARRYGFASLLPEETGELGSDVPFLADGAPLAWGGGRGERLLPLSPGVQAKGFLVFPRWVSCTAEAYGRLDALREARGLSQELPDREEGERILSDLRERRVVGLLPNDFVSVSESLHGEYREAWALAEWAGALAWGLCGSGSGWFVVLDPRADATSLGQVLGRLSWVRRLVAWEG